MEVIAGIDIGGTKCAVSFIHMNGDEVEFLSKEKRNLYTLNLERCSLPISG